MLRRLCILQQQVSEPSESQMRMRLIFPIFRDRSSIQPADLGKAKVKSAKETMQAINPDVKVNTYRKFITSENIMDIIKDYDFIIDGTDNFPAKFLINDACVMAGKPFSSCRNHSFQRTADDLCSGRGTVLQMCIQGSAAEGCCTDL